MLHVREAADASSTAIGELAHDAQAIEVIQTNSDRTWGLVNTGERSGWVSLRFLKRSMEDWTRPITDNVLPGIEDFAITRCSGTEPFWSMSKIPGSDAVTFTMMGRESMIGAFVTRSDSRNATDRFTVGALLERETGGAQGELLATFRGQTCSDGMSDMTYGIDVDILFTDPESDSERQMHLLSGCCSIQPHAK